MLTVLIDASGENSYVIHSINGWGSIADPMIEINSHANYLHL